MTKKRMLSGVLICLGMLIVANVAAWAQANNDGVVTINGGRNTVLMKAPSQTITPAAGPSPELVTIYSNLGKGNNVYNAVAGYGIFGTDVGQPWPQSVACGFRPRADHTVTEIQVGATYVQGPNSLIVSLNADNHHKPGKALHTWHFANLPTFGQCCTLQTGKLAAGIPVKKGTMYWVVLRPSPQHQDTYDVWNNNFKDLQGAFSNNIGSGWTQQSFQTLGAFGVFGK
jgi:hypothetical protein